MPNACNPTAKASPDMYANEQTQAPRQDQRPGRMCDDALTVAVALRMLVSETGWGIMQPVLSRCKARQRAVSDHKCHTN